MKAAEQTPAKKLFNTFQVDRDRSRDRPMESTNQIQTDSLAYIMKSVGRRYHGCTFQNYQCSSDAQSSAVAKCRQYVRRFGVHFRNGESLVLIGPKGTGKDHLLVATLKAIYEGYPSGRPGRIVYRDGLTLFAQFRDTIRTQQTESRIIETLERPDLLAISDPLPPIGKLSEYEQRMLLRLVDRRYRQCRPLAVTINVASRKELEDRIGPQSADRIVDGAVVVECNWDSFRKKGSQS